MSIERDYPTTETEKITQLEAELKSLNDEIRDLRYMAEEISEKLHIRKVRRQIILREMDGDDEYED